MKLKPCPFCGGEAGVSERYDEYCAVRCITCGAKTNFSMTKKGAIEAWNRREPIDKIVEQLEEASYWTEPTYDEDGYSYEDEIEVIDLSDAIEIVRGGQNE